MATPKYPAGYDHDKATAIVAKMAAEMPPAVLQTMRELDEHTLLHVVAEKAIEALLDTLAFASRAQARCGLCRDGGTTCAHCIADNLRAENVIRTAQTLAVMTYVATQPGSRIAAAREAAQERTEQTPSGQRD